MFMYEKHKTRRFNIKSTMLMPLMLFSLASQAGDMFPEATFVTLKKANQVVKYPDQAVWEGGPNMLYSSITPDGKMLLVTSPNTASVYAFDSKTGKQLAIVKVGKASKGLKISPDGKEAYVSNEAGNSISVIDLKQLKVVDTIQTEKMPHNVRFNAKGDTAYVTLQGGAGLGVIDTRTRKVTSIIPLPGLIGPHNMDLSMDEKRAYVRDTVGKVAVVNLETAKVEKLIDVGKGHAGIDVIPNGKYVFTGAISDNIVTVIDTDTLSVVKKIDVGVGPHGVRASKDSRYVYVTITSENKVVVIDTSTLSVVKKYSTGKFPFWVAVNGNP